MSPEYIRKAMDHASAEDKESEVGRESATKDGKESQVESGQAAAEKYFGMGWATSEPADELACRDAAVADAGLCDQTSSVFRGGRVQRVTIYKDRLGSRNCFVLFDRNASAVLARACILEMQGGEWRLVNVRGAWPLG